MSLRLALTVISGDYPQMMEDNKRQMAKAATGAMRDAADLIRSRGRSAIGGGGFPQKWQNAFRVDLSPKNGVSLNPSALAHDEIPYAGVFQGGTTIAGKPLLWLPLDNVPVGDKGRQLSPKEYVTLVGPLRSLNRPGQPPLLIGQASSATISRATKKAVRVSRKALKSGTIKGQWVPLFVGVHNITEPKRFDITSIVEDVADQLGDLYAKNFNENEQ